MEIETQKQRWFQALVWFLPTTLEVVIYIFACGLTLAMSNIDAVRNFLYVSGDFHPISAGVGIIDYFLTKLVGQKIAGSLSLGLFWAMVGVVINLVWIIFANFSTELNNDLVFSNYIHPRAADPKAPLREFGIKFAFRVGVTIIFIFLFGFTTKYGLPFITTRFASVIKNWPSSKNIGTVLWVSLFEILLLHSFIILARLATLRKRVFG